MRTSIQLLVALIALLYLAVPVAAHEGHDHEPPPPVNANVAPRADASSEDFEVVAVARGDGLEIYLDTFRENAPVEGASLEVDTPAGILKPTHRGAGIYTVAAPFVLNPGHYDLAITIAAGDKVDVLTTTLDIPPKEATVAAATSDGAHEDIHFPYGLPGLIAAFAAVFFGGFVAARLFRSTPHAAAAGFLALALPLVATPDAHAQSAEAALIDKQVPIQARDIAQRAADGSVFVPKTSQRILAIRTEFTAVREHARNVELPGRIIPDPNSSGLVQASVGGRLSPPEGGFKVLGATVRVGDILALVQPPLPSADATVQAQQARELDQQIAITRRKVERLSAIQDIIAKAQLEDARIELKGLTERRANLDRVNSEPEPLLAPVSGVIASANAVAGQMAEPSSIIYQIVDPTKLRVEALAFEPQELTQAATAQLADGRKLDLSYLGTGLADRNQAIPVQFMVTGDASGLRSGQFVTVFATTSEKRKGIALPRAAVLRASNGQHIVYEHTAPERFIAREVRTVGVDGERVLVVSGLEPSKRIVTRGAELLDQLR